MILLKKQQIVSHNSKQFYAEDLKKNVDSAINQAYPSHKNTSTFKELLFNGNFSTICIKGQFIHVSTIV